MSKIRAIPSIAAAALLLIVLCLDTVPAETRGIDVVEFAAGWKAMVGRNVTVSGCRIAGFLSDAVGCYAEKAPSRVAIDSATLDRQSLRDLLKNCVGLAPPQTCRVSVSGVVEEDPMHRPRLGNAVVIWRKP